MKKMTVFLITKQPRVGLCKKRLSDHISQSEILRMTRNNIDNFLIISKSSKKYDARLAIFPQKLIYRSFKGIKILNTVPQKNKDLGKKIWDLKNTTLGPLLIIGSDIPNIKKKYIDDAFKIIESKNVVLGPSEDGGFWLIGFSNKNPLKYPFGQIAWSEENTLINTIEQLKYYKITFGMCKKMKDIDTFQDYISFYKN